MATKKLIEVALPLEKINAESAREKSIRHGHPSTLHLWWARRPLAAARAVIWSSLVDDPSSHPEKFPTEEEQNRERQRLFKILEELVMWENSNNERVLNAAKEEILKSTNGNPPEFLDPFAGGGAIPLEAQRLGLKAHAHDLNPVSVMINKAMIEIPPRFAGKPPVNPDARASHMAQTWTGANGLAEDVRYYGEWMKNEAFKRIGHLYPKVKVPRELGGGEATVIAWIWARTVKCPNPACGCETPLLKSFVLSNSKKVTVNPYVDDENNVSFHLEYGGSKREGGTVNRKGAKCIKCGSPISFSYIREKSKETSLNTSLIALVAEGKKGKIYIPADREQSLMSVTQRPEAFSLGSLAYYPGYINPVAYGIEKIEDLFTNRQLVSIKQFSDLIPAVQSQIMEDGKYLHYQGSEVSLENGGTGLLAYSEAIATYLAFAVDKLADRSSSLCGWDSSRDGMRNTFGLTGMPMSWDFAEANPFSGSSGCFDNMLDWIERCIVNSPNADFIGSTLQMDAQSDSGLRNIMVSTDPPYYSNVPYADFADYFYVWLRNSLKHIYPTLFSTMLTPKTEELVADPYRAGNKENAAKHFEEGMVIACKQINVCSSDEIPVTIYYAFKQSDKEDSANDKYGASTGWEKMLAAIIRAGFAITGTWPVRTELANRSRGLGSNALASSIVLVCRKRSDDAPKTTRRNLVNQLRRELRPALKKLQESNIAPVDLAQSAIGPGMGVFSRYKEVLEADGTPMSVRSALSVINEEIDLYFNEQVGDMDSASRFCVDLYTQNAFNDIKYGEAEILATAKSTSIPMMASHGVLYAKAGIVHLIDRSEMTEKYDSNEQCIWMLTQQLTQAMAKGGIEACAKILADIFGSNGERAKDLAYRLYTIAERKNWANEAYAYNALVVAWPDIQARAAALKEIVPEQLDLFSTGMLDQ